MGTRTMRFRTLALVLLSACDLGLGDVSLGESEQAIDPTLPPAHPAPWLFITDPVDNPEGATAAYLPGAGQVTPIGVYQYSIPLE